MLNKNTKPKHSKITEVKMPKKNNTLFLPRLLTAWVFFVMGSVYKSLEIRLGVGSHVGSGKSSFGVRKSNVETRDLHTWHTIVGVRVLLF